MKYLVTGGCGFVGSAICRALVEAQTGAEVTSLGNQRRHGPERNRPGLERLGVRVVGTLCDAWCTPAYPRR